MSASFTFKAAAPPVARFGFHVTVPSWSRAVVSRDGMLIGERGPGRYRRARRSEWHLVDMRPSILTLPTQEVLTSDGVQVRVSAIATITVVDPTAWVSASESPLEVIYSALQIALRDRVAAMELASVSSSRSTLLDGVEAELATQFAMIGATVTGISLKDVTLPQEVRSALAQVALTKQHGLAELERARAEAASLRSLANTAKLLAENPTLLQLRTLQAASDGAQVVIHRGEGETR
ncbi:MAG: slipin family protein [Salinibacterium sp.]|nr:MAG: slipin family protein [Salinibacterium sp.]